MSDSIIIVGASHAGIACAEQLRTNGFSGQIQLIDRLSGIPFERPPLSKGFLQADGSDDQKFLLRRSDWFTSREITLIDGREVTAIDPGTKQVQLDDGQLCKYDLVNEQFDHVHHQKDANKTSLDSLQHAYLTDEETLYLFRHSGFFDFNTVTNDFDFFKKIDLASITLFPMFVIVLLTASKLLLPTICSVIQGMSILLIFSSHINLLSLKTVMTSPICIISSNL